MFIIDDKELSTGNLFPRRSDTAFCVVCAKPVDLLTFQTSAEIFKTDLQDIEHLAKQGEIHRIHNRRGDVMICSDSLFTCFDNRQTRLLDSHFTIEIEKSFERAGGL